MATAPASASPPAPLRARLRRELTPLLLTVALLVVARSSFANHYHVPSGSMEPTLRPGDRVLVDMGAYGLRIALHRQGAGAARASPAR